MYLLALLVLPFDAKSSDMSPRSASGAESARSKLKEFDKLGSVLFMTFIGLLLACVNRGNELGWRSTPILGMAIGALCVLPLLICVERRAASPLLPLRMFSERSNLTILLSNNCMWACYMGSYLLIPVFMQEARGMGPAFVGLLVFIRPITGSLCAMVLSKKLGSDSPPPLTRLLTVGATLCFVASVAYGACGEVSAEMLPWTIVFALVIQGAGGFIFSIRESEPLRTLALAPLLSLGLTKVLRWAQRLTR